MFTYQHRNADRNADLLEAGAWAIKKQHQMKTIDYKEELSTKKLSVDAAISHTDAKPVDHWKQNKQSDPWSTVALRGK